MIIITAHSYLVLFICQALWQIHYMHALSIIFINSYLYLETLRNLPKIIQLVYVKGLI